MFIKQYAAEVMHKLTAMLAEYGCDGCDKLTKVGMHPCMQASQRHYTLYTIYGHCVVH